MATARTLTTNEPIYWFAALDKALNAGNYKAAGEAQEELARLGILVRFRKRQPTAIEEAKGGPGQWQQTGRIAPPSRPYPACIGGTMFAASDLAKRISRNPKLVTSFLSRFAEKNPDCRVENDNKRQNEPTYLYRTAEVWPALVKWAGENP